MTRFSFKFIVLILTFIQSNNLSTQISTDSLPKISIQELMFPSLPNKIDTLFFPFYNGVQMIMVDHISYWDRKIVFLEQTQPMAMPHSMHNPPPLGNEFFFRNDKGEIIQSFNSPYTLKLLNQHFKNIPIYKNSTKPIHQVFKYHHQVNIVTSGAWAYSPNSLYYFKGLYKVSNANYFQTSPSYNKINNNNEKVKFGLIDSLGTVQIPIEYNEILPLGDDLLVNKNEKWGIIDKKLNEVVPLQYDTYKNYYLDNDNNKYIYFYNKNQYTAVYNIKTKELKALNHYDEIYWIDNFNQRDYYPVFKNRKMGFINGEYEEIIPPQYLILEHFRNDFTCANKGLKFGFINNKGEEVIPFIYDYAEPFNREGVALVAKDGQLYCIDKKGKIQDKCGKIPTWKSQTKLPDNLLQVYISNGPYFGYYAIVDAINYQLKFPMSNQLMLRGVGDEEIFGFLQNDKMALYNFKTDEKTDFVYDITYNGFYEGSIIMKKDGKFGLVNKNFESVLDFKYEYLSVYLTNKDFLIFKENNLFGLINMKGKVKVKPIYQSIDDYLPFARVYRNDKQGILNSNGKEVIPCEYQKVEKFCDYYMLKKNDKYGIVDMDYQEILPCIYDKIERCKNEGFSYFYVTLNGVFQNIPRDD